MRTSVRLSRRRPAESLPGVHGTARVDRRVAALLPRLRPGDVAVLDVLDVDRPTAQALADARVGAVVDASAMISGRFPNLGPQLLAEAGIILVDRVGPEGLAAIRDGATVRVHDGAVHVGERVVAHGRELDTTTLDAEMTAARLGMISQLQTFTHTSTEFLRREQDLLLHGTGLPSLHTTMTDRPVVVVTDAHEFGVRLKALRPFLREQDPVLVGVDAGADALLAAGFGPHVVVLTAAAEQPSAKALKAARDVVLIVEPGVGKSATERLERLGVRPHRLETTAAAEDAALMLADAADARVIVGVGMHASLEEFLDRSRADLASTYLTRLKVGGRLVDASTVRTLYSGRVRPRHLFWVVLACLVALAVAVATTPVGHEWAVDALAWSADLASTVADTVTGWFS